MGSANRQSRKFGVASEEKMNAAKNKSIDSPAAATVKAKRGMQIVSPRQSLWDSCRIDPEPATPVRGDDAVLHDGERRGRRSAKFPDLNITATARELGITKSHLSKVLGGSVRPSIRLALRLTAVLNKDMNHVVSLYDRRVDSTPKFNTRKKAKSR